MKWALRLLPPLFGQPQHEHGGMLQRCEDISINKLLLLRREAAMTPKQIAYLHRLDQDRQTMDEDIKTLTKEFNAFTGHLKPSMEYSLAIPLDGKNNVPRNPIAWPDDLRETIQGRVGKWKSQRNVMRQMHVLLSSSNEALAVPEDSFDDLESEL